MMISGLGQTVDVYETSNSTPYLEDIVKKMKGRLSEAKTLTIDMDSLSIDNGWLTVNGDDRLLDLDDSDYEKLCKLLRIPVSYLLRLPQTMRKSNIEYWFSYFGEKEVEIIYNKDGIISIEYEITIKPVDVLEKVCESIPHAKIFKIVNQTNNQQFDIYSEDLFFETSRDGYFAGLRVIVKSGLNAPDISPIFLNVNTCAIIECSSCLEKMSIKSLSYVDIIRVIKERIDFCAQSFNGLFRQFLGIAEEKINEPQRRIALYCREHNVPDRVKAYAISTFTEGLVMEPTYEDIICLFSVLGYIDEIKQSSERKLQQLAGYIVSRTKAEERCTKCDATLVQE